MKEPRTDETHSLVVDLSATPEAPQCELPVNAPSEHVRGKFMALAGALLVTGGTAWYGTHELFQAPSVSVEQVAAVAYVEPPQAPTGPDPFTDISLEAHAALVYDLTEGRALFGRSENEALPLASLTKLMTALVAKDVATVSSVAIPAESILREGDSGLTAGEVWSVDDLISFMLVTSSNDAADGLAVSLMGRDAFVRRMNETARTLGIGAEFRDPTGLDVSEEVSGGKGSAKDIALLLKHVVARDASLLNGTTKPSTTFTTNTATHVAENTNTITGTVPGLAGSKTGYTLLAGGNLAVVFDPGPGTPLAVVVLGSSREGRFADVQKLVDASLAYIADGWYEARLREERAGEP